MKVHLVTDTSTVSICWLDTAAGPNIATLQLELQREHRLGTVSSPPHPIVHGQDITGFRPRGLALA